MRIWDLPPNILCRAHLLGEHRELHAIWTIISQAKTGYAKHPETLRWYGKLKALYTHHEKLVLEMQKRGYAHKSPLDKSLALGDSKQKEYVHTPQEQKEIIKSKKCGCRV